MNEEILLIDPDNLELGYALSQTPRRRVNLCATPGSSTTDLSTNGWDTVSVLKIAYVNSAIVAAKSSPANFSYTEPKSSYAASGNFSDWSVVPGGDGTYIHLSLPLSSISGWYVSGSSRQNFTSSGGHVIIAVKLSMLSTAIADQKNLMLRTSSSDPDDPPAFLVSDELSAFSPASASWAKYVFESAITAWSNANLDKFQHIFSQISLNQIADKQAWDFLDPSYTTYAYAQASGGTNPVLGILCMTGTRQPSEQTNCVDVRAIPDACQGGFLISQERFLEDLLIPSLHLCWSDAAADKFKLGDNNFELQSGQTIALPKVTHAGSDYHPKLTSFTFEITGQIITITSYTTTDISPGIQAWCSASHQYEITLGQNNSGEQTLVYKKTGTPVTNHGYTLSEAVKVTSIILGIITAVVLVILSVLTDGGALIVASLIAGALLGTAAATPEIIAAVNSGDSPSIDLMSFNISHPITWSGGKAFALTYASLNGCLQLGGNLGLPDK